MKRFSLFVTILLLCILGLVAMPAFAQETTPEPIAEATPESVVIPEVSSSDVYKEALEIGTQIGESSGFFKGAGIASLFTLATGGLFLTLLLRSTVVQTMVEGLIYSRLDPDAIQKIHGTGAIFKEVGVVIEKVTDGKPNDAPASAPPSTNWQS